MPLGSKGLHEPELLFGLNTAKNLGVLQLSFQRLVAEARELGTRHGQPIVDQAGLPGDGQGGGGVVSGDHDHPNTSSLALCDRLGYIVSNGVFQADQAEERKFEIMLGGGQCSRIENGPRHAEHPKAFVGHGRHLCGDALVLLGAKMAQADDGLWRALGGDHPLLLVGRLPNSGHRQQLAGQRVVLDQQPV